MKRNTLRFLTVLLSLFVLTTIFVIPAAAATESAFPADESLTTTESAPSDNFLNIGYVSVFFLDKIIDTIPWAQFSHVVWQNVMVNSGSDPTLHVQNGYPWSQISSFVNACHANDVEALVCLFGTSDLNSVTANPSLRTQLVTNLTNLVNQYNLDGVNIDWEGSASPSTYAQFVKELRASMPDKTITVIGTFLGPPVNIDASAEPYLDYVTIMSYDYWVVPSYGTLDTIAGTLQLWNNAGFPKEKLILGIPFFGTTAAGTTGWTPYSTILGTVNPTPDQNNGGGYYFNGPELVKQKVRYVRDNGYGGVFNYELGTDALSDARSLTAAVWEAINS